MVDLGGLGTSEQGMELTPVKASFGAEVLGIDLSEGLSEEMVNQQKAALLSHQFLLFREQSLNPPDQVRLSLRGSNGGNRRDQQNKKPPSEGGCFRSAGGADIVGCRGRIWTYGL